MSDVQIRGVRYQAEYLHRAVLGLLAWVLLVAGVLKTHGLLADGDQLWGSSWLLAGAIVVECVVAAILVCDPRRRRAWLVGLCFFSFLAVIAWSETRGGRSHCSCFGPLEISPWWTLSFDLAAVTVLLAMGPGRCRTRIWRGDPRTEWGPGAAGWIPGRMVVCGAALCLMTVAIAQGVAAGRLPEGVVILEPITWQGKPLPILEAIDIGRELAVGQWLMVLVHQACPLCDRWLDRLAEQARQASVGEAPRRIAVIEVPPYAEEDTFASKVRGFRHGRLSDQREWFVTTPTVIGLVDGRVATVVQDAI